MAKYICREEFLADGARLLKNVYLLDNKAARNAYAAWEERAQPSKQEKLAVQAMARRVLIACKRSRVEAL